MGSYVLRLRPRRLRGEGRVTDAGPCWAGGCEVGRHAAYGVDDSTGPA